MSERKVGDVKKLFQAAIFHVLTLDLSVQQTCNTLTMRAVEPFIALRTSSAGVFHNRLLDWCIWENRQPDKTVFLQSLGGKKILFSFIGDKILLPAGTDNSLAASLSHAGE